MFRGPGAGRMLRRSEVVLVGSRREFRWSGRVLRGAGRTLRGVRRVVMGLGRVFREFGRILIGPGAGSMLK